MAVKAEEDLLAVPSLEEDDLDQLEEGDTLEPEWELPPSKMVQISVADLFAGVQTGEINTSPDYQREAVWNPTNQQNIIDSIINDFYVPPLLFAARVEVDPEEPDVEYAVMNVVDGKQRLTSIVRFMSGAIPYIHRSTKRRYYWTAPEGRKGALLPESWKRLFKSKTLYCVQWDHLSDELEREIFKRVQYGMQLSPAEKMHAISSPWADMVRMLSKQYIADGLSNAIKWTRNRGQDFQFAAQILYLIWRPERFQFPTAALLDKWLRNEDPPSDDFKREADAVFRDYLGLALKPETSYAFVGIADRLAPVEVVMIGFLLHTIRNASQMDKAREVDGLRRATREKFIDIRSNNRVTTFMFEYIADAMGRAYATIGMKTNGAGKSPSKKRKRDQNDREWRPGARIGLGPGH
ncbi:hypothetical protein DACRYDRAFT_105258 [Dacryopinax primogenitus]|uniref:GmrSD restriction endonucleases N-terminal domain-containing protein n=1 Tax=Dacryopinax primogenitus (strain DJM 731) TaxID=1858805 RepID=M5G7T6_DACPD|nr:uncharacterized protein DACRYDRAFT_105258 [Dacryopinax primogenitus]EJU04190.1 hypothetical protein DACRYDRAFT_105258 [Dacryopinax primogenitus]